MENSKLSNGQIKKCEIVVIGGGPAGYTSAIRLGQLGKKVVLVEKGHLGGICLNVGCIPSKALIHVADLYHKTKHSSKIGIEANNVNLDLKKMQIWKEGIVTKLRNGIEFLCKSNNVELIRGSASFLSNTQISISLNDGTNITLKFESAIIATGSIPMDVASAKLNEINIIGSSEALNTNEIPKRILVVGSGYIGMELSTFYAKIGSSVTIAERSDDLLKLIDLDLRDVVRKRANELGITFLFNTSVVSCETDGKPNSIVTVNLKDIISGKESKIEVDKVLVAIGRKPLTEGIGLEKINVQKDARGFVVVDHKFMTTEKNIYAIGDLIGGQMLAHKGYAEGKLCSEIIAGKRDNGDIALIPYVVFSDPEIAIVGLSEEEAKKKGLKINISKYPFSALGRAAAIDDSNGFVKIIADFDTNKILGFHIVGPDASNIVGELSLTLSMGLSLENVASTIHPHPSLSEAIGEAAELMLGKSVHFLNKKK